MKKLLSLLIAILAISAAAQTPRQREPFNGILLTLDGKPIKKARVYVRTPKDFAITDSEGKFGLTNVEANDTLKIKIKKDVYYIPVEGRRAIRIRLADQTNFHSDYDDQLFSQGYGFVSRRERTQAGDIIGGETLRRTGQTNILDALQGRVPGLVITGYGSQRSVTIRGTRSFYGDSTPLYLIDGVIVDSLEGLNIYDVDYVEVMKEGSIYGSRGANGAILVYTRRY